MKPIARRVAAVSAVAVAALFSLIATVHGQSSTGGTMSYDPANNWNIFTDTSGGWHAPLAIRNSLAPKNNVVEFTVNTDNQFVITAYGNGEPQASLDLDTNGAVALTGSSGGGIGTDWSSGDTCLPSAWNTPCSPSALRINYNGVVTQYQGQPTSGNGISTIQYWADSSLTGSFGPYTIHNTNASGYASAGMYRLDGYMTVTGAAAASSARFFVGYWDETGLQYQNSGAADPFQALGDKLPFSFVFFSQAGKPVTISSSIVGGNPTYTIHLRLQAL